MISRTAINMAAFRALENARPLEDRLFEDRYAARFTGSGERLLLSLAGLRVVRRALERYADARAPGARSSGVARTRLIDDWLAAECEDGAEQAVMLGAGFDCRALRLPFLARLRVFELDRAELLARKVERLGARPANLVSAPIDFLTESIGERLIASGFDPTQRSIFVWEGVSNYLDDAAVGTVLQTVANLKARIIFTYVHADAVSGTFDAPGLPALLRHLRRIGEPWTFGLRPEDLNDYLQKHGMRCCMDVGAAEYRALYRRADAKAQQGYEFYRVVLAEPA